MKCRHYAKAVSVCLGVALLTNAWCPFPAVSVSADSAPVLEIIDTTVLQEELSESREVSIDIMLTDNESGFIASSFGIHYADELTYTDYEATSAVGQKYQVICNPEEHLLWCIAATDINSPAACALQEEKIFTFTFTISEEYTGGNLPLEFVWEGKDFSDAYWYVSKTSNIIEDIQANSKNGILSLYNPDGETLCHTQLDMNPDTTHQMEVYGVTSDIFWFSSDNSVATVDNNGLVYAVSPGTCTINAYIDNQIFTCNVTVTEAYYYSVLDQGEVYLTDSEHVYIMTYPDAAGTVTWLSSSPDIISIDENGSMIPLRDGQVIIFGTDTGSGTTYPRTVIVELSSETTNQVTDTTESDTVSDVTKSPSGDVDGNGLVNIMDVIMLNKTILGKEDMTEEQVKSADFNSNGKPDSEDALELMKVIVGLR